MGLIAMSERDLQRIEVLSKVVGGWMNAARSPAGGWPASLDIDEDRWPEAIYLLLSDDDVRYETR
ncbi:hypothetical protein BA011_26795 (plasmid) [Rhizobium leguminosarum]|uniref:Uncharacterized protein n=1 Tax=Rhizobium leguminosarum TaxID=384 RepID=A0A1B1CHX2_RHILE|nr:hypothetical protein BA011_26795 [Rhizobium leguminosarum]